MYNLYLRYDRAFKQRIYLITTELNKDYLFNVMGTTGNIYKVCISDTHYSCDCPDYLNRKSYCKHLFFILGKVLNISPTDIFSNNYNLNSITDYINTNNILQNFIKDDLVTKFNNIKLNSDICVKQKINEICAICFDDLDKTDDLVYCKYVCGNSVHSKCFKQWSLIKKNQCVCVYCRNQIDNNKKGYINLID